MYIAIINIINIRTLSKQMTAAKSVKPPKAVSITAKIYLVVYNVVQFLGWSYIFYLSASYFTEGLHAFSSETLWKKVKLPLMVFQTGAVLEVIHSLIKIVPNSPGVTLVQVFSRVFLLWPIVYLVPESRHQIGFPMMISAWYITETLRYLYYSCSLLNFIPSFLKWCRYSFFILLYPIGITGELICCYFALPHYEATQNFSISLPNSYNFTFSFWYLIVVIMLLYIPVFPQLYGHMFSQRRKILGGASKKVD